MFIFDQPYISDVAENYLIESQAPLLENEFALKCVSETANHISDAEAVEQLERDNFRWLYSNSENAIAWIVKTFGADSELALKIDLFKNKFKFREKTAALFPDVSFFKIAAADIASFTFDRVGAPFIIKPMVGFISAGVHRVNTAEEWESVRAQLLEETKETAHAFPEEVISSAFFIVESIIEGDEYAVDAYFDDDNRPVVLNILKHRFNGDQDMSDRLYITSAEIIASRLASIEHFLSDLAELGDFRGLPVHTEIRIDDSDRIRPIEVNPLRFAGWCSTDIASYAYGINVYDCFAKKKKPDWDAVLEKAGTDTFAMAVIERPTPLRDDQVFDYDKLGKEITSVLCMRKMDYRTFPMYAFLFFSVSKETEHELDTLLTLDPEAFVVDNALTPAHRRTR
ncbi:ATP-grasp domain-containing protein [Desulfoluna spongiiphila]|uniref:ATP-grasp domain-containing protein n=1 Tax=Desulfoluna spongiiphila TaxID=419481 RepID=UPI00125B7F22|nr:ATP-grasp domain-containing protein [Desulfoluna spongiiphila]VVS94202.1 atp-grasp fold [Desulfoluna spongiiphila]